MIDYATKFSSGLSYSTFLEKYGTDEYRRRWQAVHSAIQLTEAQRGLLGSFQRQMHVACMAGAWCGDCVDQCPILDHFAAASDCIALRFFDRDDHPDLAAELQVCGAARVPAVVLLSEDFTPVSRFGDRTLAKYRTVAAQNIGPSCPTGLAAPTDSLLQSVVQEWLDVFERAHLILRTSARLRKLHGD